MPFDPPEVRLLAMMNMTFTANRILLFFDGIEDRIKLWEIIPIDCLFQLFDFIDEDILQ